MTLQQALANLYNASSHAPLTKDQHITCENSYNMLMKFITDREEEKHYQLDMQAPCEPPVVEVLATEKKVVGGPKDK